jgi:ATP synthase mitochondrial F1 complex assembly factor 2
MPEASVENVHSRIARRKKQAEMLKRGQELRAATGGASGGMRRFWKHVYVKRAEGNPVCIFGSLL